GGLKSITGFGSYDREYILKTQIIPCNRRNVDKSSILIKLSRYLAVVFTYDEDLNDLYFPKFYNLLINLRPNNDKSSENLYYVRYLIRSYYKIVNKTEYYNHGIFNKKIITREILDQFYQTYFEMLTKSS